MQTLSITPLEIVTDCRAGIKRCKTSAINSLKNCSTENIKEIQEITDFILQQSKSIFSNLDKACKALRIPVSSYLPCFKCLIETINHDLFKNILKNYEVRIFFEEKNNHIKQGAYINSLSIKINNLNFFYEINNILVSASDIEEIRIVNPA